MKYFIFLMSLLLAVNPYAYAQTLEELLALEEGKSEKPRLEEASFKTTRIVNAHSIENPAQKQLMFIIAHHFGTLSSGPYELFGLDESNIRFGFEYGLTDRLCLMMGRSSFEKTFDASAKFRILRQGSGQGSMPISLSWLGGTYANSLRYADATREYPASARLSYASQLLLARKWNPALTTQLSAFWVHKNMVEKMSDANDHYAAALGARYKLSKRVSLNAEYIYRLTKETERDFFDALGIGLDIETGGHVFQVYLTNARGLIEPQFITTTNDNALKGHLRPGFNLTRFFAL